jgi:hypothetical protein
MTKWVPDPARGLDDPREAVGPVVTVAGEHAHAIAVALKAGAKAVKFDFVDPIVAGRDRGSTDGQAEVKGAWHGLQIGVRRSGCQRSGNLQWTSQPRAGRRDTHDTLSWSNEKSLKRRLFTLSKSRNGGNGASTAMEKLND